MITFTKSNADNMEAFKNDIRVAIIKMSAEAIEPIYRDYERFDEEIARKLKNKEITYKEARYAFAEDYYSWDLSDLRIEGNSVLFDDDFRIEDTYSDGGYSLDKMVNDLLKNYPDMQVYGFGYIDYHIAGNSYILFSKDGHTVFAESEDHDFIGWLDLFDGLSIDEILKRMGHYKYNMDQLKEDISEFIKGNVWSFTPAELLNTLGLNEAAEYLYPEG
ncbi:MAG: hypothetical protein IKP14_12375 [Clostridiales bacterium]|nr:hypothetical protein [Clostridiales bacterium]